MPSAEMQRAAGERVRPSFIRELLGNPASRSASSWNRRGGGPPVGGEGAPVGEEEEDRRGGGPPARKDEEYRRVRRTGNDEEAVEVEARSPPDNTGCMEGIIKYRDLNDFYPAARVAKKQKVHVKARCSLNVENAALSRWSLSAHDATQ
ncbi:unnamed protein product [Miscanthus lutarioriparius]|uniref:Uncharacterized protein n=1 Tax=Miscanthus lutarioriparius TaxID=422564 RepID=A0A811MYL5_9POAL|nr:unnamed protein product [Miscanthus lutarioriparius]